MSEHDREKARAIEESRRLRQEKKAAAIARSHQIQAIKGARDILPPESALWNRLEQTAREVFGTFGFSEIRVPMFEQTELFARSVGQETDIVSKQMYTFEDYETTDLAELRALVVTYAPPDNINDPFEFLGLMNEFLLVSDGEFLKGRIQKTP